MTDRELLKEARDLIVMCSLLDKSGQSEIMVDKIDKQLSIANVSKSLPTEDAKFIYSLLPDWVKNKAPEGLDPTMYGTLSKEGDDEIQERVKQILGNVC